MNIDPTKQNPSEPAFTYPRIKRYYAKVLEPFLVVSTFWVDVDDPYEPPLSQIEDLYNHNPLKEAVLSDIVLDFQPVSDIHPSTFKFITSKDPNSMLLEPNSPEVRIVEGASGNYKAIVTDPCLVSFRLFIERRERGLSEKDLVMNRYLELRPSLFAYPDPIVGNSDPNQLRYIQLVSLRDDSFPFVLLVENWKND